MEDKKTIRIDLRFNKLPEKQFPLDGIFYESLKSDKKEVIKQLLYLFVSYASKGSKHNYNELQQHYFMLLMRDAFTEMGKNLGKNTESWKDLLIIYYSKGCQNTLSFRNFLQLLPEFALYVGQKEEKIEDALKNFIDVLIATFNNKVKPEIVGKLIDVEHVISEDSREYINKLTHDLAKLYKLYFPNEVTKTKCTQNRLKEKSLESFLAFLKDFEIFPKLISARDIFYIFNESCDAEPNKFVYQAEQPTIIMNELGEVFKFSKFLQSLLVISRRVFSKLKKIDNEEEWDGQQKYILRTLFEYMQIVKTTNKKKKKFVYQKFCFIVLEEYPEKQISKEVQRKSRVMKKLVPEMKFMNIIDKLTF